MSDDLEIPSMDGSTKDSLRRERDEARADLAKAEADVVALRKALAKAASWGVGATDAMGQELKAEWRSDVALIRAALSAEHPGSELLADVRAAVEELGLLTKVGANIVFTVPERDNPHHSEMCHAVGRGTSALTRLSRWVKP